MSATLLLITGSLLLLLGPRVGRSRPLPVDSSRQTGPAPWDELLGRMRAVGGSRRAAAQRIDLERWPALIQQMAALLRAGIEPAAVWAALREQGRGEAREEAGAVGRDIDELIRCAHEGALLGADPARSLRTARLYHPRSRAVRDALAAAWAVSGRTGAPLAGVLEGLARAVEDELDALAARDTALAGPKATARILSTLPLLGLGLGMVMGTDPLGVLLGMVWGHLALALGLGLSAAGLLWTRRLVCGAEEAAP